MVEDRVDHFLVAVHDLADALRKACLEKQFSQYIGERRVALARLDDERVPRRDRRATHPQRDHAGEVEGGNPRADANRLAHRIDVDAWAGTLGIFALQDVRDAAAELDDFEAALDIALAVGNDLAVLARQQMRQLIHPRLDQRLEVEHHPRASLWVGHRPARLRLQRRVDRTLQHRRIAQRHPRLHRPGVRIEHVAVARREGSTTAQEMVDLSHHSSLTNPSPVRRWPTIAAIRRF